MSQERQPPLWLTAAEVATWFKVPLAIITDLVLAEEIPYRVVGADILRFSVLELDEWSRKSLPPGAARRLPIEPVKPKGPGGRPRGGTRARMQALEEEAFRRMAADAADAEVARAAAARVRAAQAEADAVTAAEAEIARD